MTNNGGCSGNATCSNGLGSFLCSCKPGYSGDGFTCYGNISWIICLSKYNINKINK